MPTRRTFLTGATLLTVDAVAPLEIFAAQKKPLLTHHVFFWLKNSGSAVDRKKLIMGLQTLKEIEIIQAMHIGLPAGTTARDVVDSSYDVSELIFFSDVEGQNTYQTHPTHVKFVENYAHLWKKVVVYDSIDIE